MDADFQIKWLDRRAGAQACHAASNRRSSGRMAGRTRRSGAPDQEAGTSEKLAWVLGDFRVSHSGVIEPGSLSAVL
jgi:hypothetical protein